MHHGDAPHPARVPASREFSDGQWLIIDDRWDFTNFETEVVAEGTVFPLQWYKLGDYSVLNRNVVISYEELRMFDNP